MDKTRFFEAAGRYSARGQLERAAREYQRILDADPRDVRALQKLAEIHQKSGRESEASALLLRVAESYAEQGFFLKAVAVYKQVLKLGETGVEVNLRLAQLYQQLGLISDATQQFQLVANHYDSVGNVKESLSALRSMVDLDPENVAGRVKLGELYAREGMADEAATELRRAAAHLKRLNRDDDHLRVLERVGQIVPDDSVTARELAQLFLTRNEPKRALARLQICFKQNPQDVDTLQLLARAFSDLGQDGKSVSVHRELSRIYRESGQSEAERRTLQRILDLVPGDPEATQALAALDDAPSGLSSLAGTSTADTDSPSPGQERTSESADAPGANAAGTAGTPGASGASGAALVPPAPENAGAAPSTSARPAATSTGSATTAGDPASGATTGSGAGAEQGAAFSWPPIPPLPSGALPETVPPDVLRILTESDVYLKYGLVAKGAEHLLTAVTQAPFHVEVQERVLEVAERQKDAAQVEATLALLVELSRRSGNHDKESTYTQALAQRSPEHPLVRAAAEAAAALDFDPEVLVEPDELELESAGLVSRALSDEELPESVTIDPEFTMAPMGDGGIIFDGDSSDIEVDDGDDGELIDLDEPGLSSAESSTEGAGDEEVSLDEPLDLEVPGDDDDLVEPDPSSPIPSSPSEPSLTPEAQDDEEDLSSWGSEVEGDGASDAEFDSAESPWDLEPAVETPAAALLDDSDPSSLADEADDSDRSALDLGDIRSIGEALDASFPASVVTPEPPDSTSASDSDSDSGAFDPFAPEDDVASGAESDPASVDPFAIYSEEPAPFADDGSIAVGAAGEEVGDEVHADPFADSPQWGDPFAEEIAEVEFLLSQELVDDARSVLESVLSRAPEHPRAIELQQVLAPQMPDAPVVETEGMRDIGRELEEELGLSTSKTPPANSAPAWSVEDVLDEFKPRISAELSEEDSQTHYDLGIAYKEMGLNEEALNEFEVALTARGARRVVDCLTMMGVCLLDLERPAEALEHLQRALGTPGLTLAASKEAHYQIGRCHEMLGAERTALDHFARVFRVDQKFRDVRQKVATLSRKLRDAQGTAPATSPAPKTSATTTQTSKSARDVSSGPRRKIGYI